MKRFFWAMYYKADGARTFKRIGGQVADRGSKKNMALVAEAAQWKALALKPVGSQIIIKQRQFIGDHPVVRKRIETLADKHFQNLDTFIKSKLKR